MIHFLKIVTLAAVTLFPLIAEAQGNGRNGNPLNCPPGLAKKNPPCVPPGLARQGITTQDYLGYDDDEWEEITQENPELAQDAAPDDDDDNHLTGPLTDAEIAEVFDIALPESGKTYGVIDGRVVALSQGDALIFDQVKQLSTPLRPSNGMAIVPDATLNESQLIAIYDLPAPDSGTTYAVIDGVIYAIPDATYGLLQIILVATAI